MEYSIGLNVQKDIACEGTRVGDYLYDYDTDTLFYELPYPFPCKFAVKSLKEITVTPWMLRLPSFLKYHNIDWLRQQLMQIKCVQNDVVLIHGAAWCKNGIGYLAVGFANSGKTTSILREMGPGVDFCTDENAIITKNRLAMPVARRTSVNRGQIRQYGLKAGKGLFWAELRHKLCPIFEPNIWIDLSYERKSFYIDKIIYLTPGANSLALLTDNEFPFYANPVIQTYAYATGFNLDGVYEKYREILKEVAC